MEAVGYQVSGQSGGLRTTACLGSACIYQCVPYFVLCQVYFNIVIVNKTLPYPQIIEDSERSCPLALVRSDALPELDSEARFGTVAIGEECRSSSYGE